MTDRAPTGSGPGVERVHGGELVGRPAPPPLYFEETTPSGIHVRYFPENKDEKIKRHYEVRRPKLKDGETSTNFLGEFDWKEVPSVTTIIDKFKDPGGLIYWAMKIGVAGTLKLYEQGHLRAARLEDGTPVLGAGGVRATMPDVVDLLEEHNLTTSNVKSDAGDRGQNVHDALEAWAKTGSMPNPDDFPPEERGYVIGLNRFLTALSVAEPEIVASERMVGSLEHEFAGRYDIELRTHKPAVFVERQYPKRAAKMFTLPPGLYVPDLKTSKRVMEAHCVQLEGYEICRKECGYEPSDDRLVVHVHPGDPKDNRQPDNPYYEVVESWAVAEDFLAYLALYKQTLKMKGRK